MTKKFSTLILLSVIITLGTIFFWTRCTPKVFVTPEESLIDEPVEITVCNLKPREQITLEASCKYGETNKWRSFATFQADDKGVVNVAKQAPISGSYSGIDPMGLFWSMAPTDKEILKEAARLYINEVLLKVIAQGKIRVQKTIHRLAASPTIVRRDIREEGVVGTFFYPKNMSHSPGIIVLGGSGGGIREELPQLLASHGYAVLALGYFGVQGLPERLKNIPLEYFQTAIQWIKNQPQVDKNRIGIFGNSRGGELVLLLGATFGEEIQAIIAHTPGAYIGEDSWTYNNKPVLPVPGIQFPSDEEEREAEKKGLIPAHMGTFDDPEESTSIYRWIFKNQSTEALEAAMIPVEKIRCPLLLISGEDDKVWQSTDFSNLVMQRLDDKKSTIVRKHLHFPDAGHGIWYPYGPSSNLPYFHPRKQHWKTLGGTVEGNARANEQSWRKVLEFLKETLGK